MIVLKSSTPFYFSSFHSLLGQPESRGLRKKEAERQRSLNIERWLKDKFREGFLQMKQMFQTHDPQKTGTVSWKVCLRVYLQMGLIMFSSHNDMSSVNMYNAN